MICLYRLRKSKKNCLSVSSFGRLYHKISYEELLNATEGFSLRNLIGSGNFGSVYNAKLGLDKKNCCSQGTQPGPVLGIMRPGAVQKNEAFYLLKKKSLKNYSTYSFY